MRKAHAFTRWTRWVAAIAAIVIGIPAILSLFITLEFSDSRAATAGGLGSGTLYIQFEVDSPVKRSRINWDVTMHGPKLDTRPLGWPLRTTRLNFNGTFVNVLIIDLRLWVLALAAMSVFIGAWLVGRRQRDPAKCPDCGYDLRGLAGGTCPECGAPVAPVR